MAENIAVVGAGICGLCTALALSTKGHQITVYERDTPPPDGDAEAAFFDWNRRGAAQFRHPHAFLAAMCNILEQKYPDLIDQFWQAGARKVTFKDMLRPNMLEKYQPEEEDEQLWMLLCRRATMETVLRRYVEGIENITINNTTNITGVTTEQNAGQLATTGLLVQQDRGEVESRLHDLIVDASGRTSKFTEWLEAKGATITIEDDDADIVYYTRHYKLNPGEKEPDRHSNERSAGDLGYIKYGVFPGDNGSFAVILCLPNHESEFHQAVKSGEGFDQICNEIPGLIPWINTQRSSSTTPSFGFGDIHAVWRHFVNSGQPATLNFFAVGDSAVRTNPLYGRGCSTGIIHAHLLADVLDASTDPMQRALKFDQFTEQELRPIFETSLSEDKRGIKRAQSILEGHQIEETSSFKKWARAAFGDAILAAAREDIRVFRGGMRTFNLMEKPGDFLKDNRIRWSVLKFMFRGRRRNAKSRLVNGPSRTELLEAISKQREVVA